MVETVTPHPYAKEIDYIAKNTLYSVGWGLITLPFFDGFTMYQTQAVARERLRIKKLCIAYAKQRGWQLWLSSNVGGIEQWSLGPNLYGHPYRHGTLQDCCRFIIEHDVQQKEDIPSK